MPTWTYLWILLISFTCTLALPTRTDDGQEQEPDQDDRLLFEAQQTADSNQGQEAPPVQGQEAPPVQGQEALPVQGQEALPVQGQEAPPVQGQEDADLLRQAAEHKIGRDAPENHGEIGSQTGEEAAHGENGDSHGAEQQQQETKHVNTGALNDDFVHNMMHDGKEDHEEEDEQIRKEKPADIRDISKMEFSEDELKGVDKEGLKNPYEGEAVYDDQEHGPNEPAKELHGVLMHGDEETGNDHRHEDEVKEAEITGDTSVVVEQVGQAGDESQVKKVDDAPPLTKDTEELVHGEGVDHDHERKPKDAGKGDGGVDRVLTENFMHDLMHGSSDNHDHDDEELKKSKVVRPRDLLNLGLDEQLLKGVDLVKMIKEDMEDYNRYMSEKGGDEESVWNIFNSFQFRYFKYGENIDDISSRQPPEEEWDDSVITRPAQHEGEDSIDHMMEVVGNDGPMNDVHNLKQRRKAEGEAGKGP